MIYLVIVILGTWIFVANQARVQPQGRWRGLFTFGTYLSVGMNIALVTMIVTQAIRPREGAILISLADALIYAIYGGALSVLAVMFATMGDIRTKFGRLLAEDRRYNPEDPVHIVATLLILLALAYIPATYLLAGGLQGVANLIAQSADDGQILVQVQDMLFFVATAFLGVGLSIRRDWKQSLARLGLRKPTANDWRWGIGSGILLFFALIPISALLSLFFTPEMLAQQQIASNQVLTTYAGSLGLGLLLAITAGIGEEILFRGALQPVFGIFITTAVFAVIHLQYTLTPASIIIFGVALVFALLRERLSTTAAIIAHIIYNSMPFVLLALFTQFA